MLVVVDQFEEVFRFLDKESVEETEAFVALLMATARQSARLIHVVLTMRS